MKRLIIMGAGGHSNVVEDIAILNGYENISFLADGDSNKAVGGINEFYKYINNADFIVAIGNGEVRKRIQTELENRGANMVSLIHPNAVVAKNVKINKGCVIVAGAVINSNSVIGKGVIVNTNSSIDHDCTVDDFTHIAPGAKICGNVKVGENTWIGAGATVINDKQICSNCMIGAGATVVKDIDLVGTYIGIPAYKK